MSEPHVPGPPAGWLIPDGYEFRNVSACRSCGNRIAWCVTKHGRSAPMNRDGTSHFADCPAADSWRHR